MLKRHLSVANVLSCTGWTGVAHESGAGPYGDWSIVAFVVCAEL